jgi:hypothetical protein
MDLTATSGFMTSSFHHMNLTVWDNIEQTFRFGNGRQSKILFTSDNNKLCTVAAILCCCSLVVWYSILLGRVGCANINVYMIGY